MTDPDRAPLDPIAPPDLADVKGLESAKRALEIAAAGGHPILLTGPSGAGETMLARRLPGLLPAPDQDARVGGVLPMPCWCPSGRGPAEEGERWGARRAGR